MGRDLMQSFLRDSVTIQRATPASATSEGDITETYPNTYTGVAADIQPLRGSRRVQEQGKVTPSTHRGFFASGTDVRVNDRVVLGSSTLVVTFVADYRHHLECDLAKVTP